MYKRIIVVAILGIFAVLGVPTAAQDVADNSTFDVITNHQDLTFLSDVLEAGVLADTLKSEGSITVFAPTDRAFQQMLDANGLSKDDLMADAELLNRILAYHTIPDAFPVATLTSRIDEDGHAFLPTLFNGSQILVSVREDGIFLNEDLLLADRGTGFVAADIGASNGVVHVIDSVLTPTTEDNRTAHVRIAHFAADAPPVEVYLDGELTAIQTTAFTDMSGWVELPVDSYEFTIASMEASIDDALLDPVEVSFGPNSWLTLALIGSVEDETLGIQVVSEDYNTPLDEDSARVTIFHPLRELSEIDVFVNGLETVSRREFPGMTEGAFIFDLPEDVYHLQVTAKDEPTSALVDMTMRFEADTFYFVSAQDTGVNVIEPLDFATVFGERLTDTLATAPRTQLAS